MIKDIERGRPFPIIQTPRTINRTVLAVILTLNTETDWDPTDSQYRSGSRAEKSVAVDPIRVE